MPGAAQLVVNFAFWAPSVAIWEEAGGRLRHVAPGGGGGGDDAEPGGRITIVQVGQH